MYIISKKERQKMSRCNLQHTLNLYYCNIPTQSGWLSCQDFSYLMCNKHIKSVSDIQHMFVPKLQNETVLSFPLNNCTKRLSDVHVNIGKRRSVLSLQFVFKDVFITR